MTTLHYAPVKEQGVAFVVVSVKDHVMNHRPNADGMVSRMCEMFRQPAVLLTETTGLYFGRQDLVNFLSGVHPSRLPWRETYI
jgi:hypothetical protein